MKVVKTALVGILVPTLALVCEGHPRETTAPQAYEVLDGVVSAVTTNTTAISVSLYTPPAEP